MFSPELEYLFLLLILTGLTVALFPESLRQAIRKPEFWLALMCYMTLGFGLDLIALSLSWWSFSEDKTIGVQLLGIPVEEFLLFLLIFFLLIGAWEFFSE